MQFSQADAVTVSGIDRPACPACATPMWLARIEPYKPDHDSRTFECPLCQHEQTAIVKYR